MAEPKKIRNWSPSAVPNGGCLMPPVETTVAQGWPTCSVQTPLRTADDASFHLPPAGDPAAVLSGGWDLPPLFGMAVGG